MERAFVIQFHSRKEGDHFDLMIEEGAALATFSLSCRPDELAAGAAITATHLADHRREYLQYEGEISGGRGSVEIVDRGTCTGEFAADCWTFTLEGRYGTASYTLTRLEAGGWRLEKSRP
jgi:hypothetical protein